jgi:hypothetical protein
VSHATWWANRKSRIGLSAIAREPPPVALGKPWWTTPPIAAPDPAQIEYVVQYQLEIMRRPPSDARNARITSVSAWLRAARRLLHERVQCERGDLATPDGALVVANRLLHSLIGRCVTAGMLDGDELAEARETKQAIAAHVARIRRERSLAKRQ